MNDLDKIIKFGLELYKNSKDIESRAWILKSDAIYFKIIMDDKLDSISHLYYKNEDYILSEVAKAV